MKKRRFPVYLMAILLCVAPRALAALPKRVEIVAEKGGRIHLKADQATLSELILRVSTFSGFRIYLTEPLRSGQPLSLEFSNRTPEEVLRSILTGYSYAVVYGKSLPVGVRELIEETGRFSESGQGFGKRPRFAVNSDLFPPGGRIKTAGAVPALTARGGSGLSAVPGSVGQVVSKEALRFLPSSTSSAATENSSALSDLDESGAESQATDTPETPGEDLEGNDPGFIREASYYISEEYKKKIILQQIDMIQKSIDSGVSDRQYEKWTAVRGEGAVASERDLLKRLEEKLAGM